MKHKFTIKFDAMFIAAVIVLLSGCKSFYENTGSNTEVGEVFAPVKITEPTSSWNVELLFNLTGARVWTAKDSRVTTHYRNSYTNNYLFGMVERKGVQDFDVEVEPLATDVQTDDSTDDTSEVNTPSGDGSNG